MDVINGIKVKKLIRVIYPLAIKLRGSCAGAAVPATLPGVNAQYLGLLWQSWERPLPIITARWVPIEVGLGGGSTYLRNHRPFISLLGPRRTKARQPPNTRWLTGKRGSERGRHLPRAAQHRTSDLRHQ